MESEKREMEPETYDDEIPNPEEEAPRDDEADTLRLAVKHHRLPPDEDVPNECFDEHLLL